jgi:hypothetical protein
MTTASHPITRLTQEFLAASAAQPVQSLWKRGVNRLLAECRWHRSSKGFGYSATWVVVSASDGKASVVTRTLPR